MMARVYTARGDSDHALATFYKSLIQNREVGNKVQIAMELEGIAEALNGHAGQSSAPDYEVRLAVRLLSAGSELRATMGAPYSIPERAVIERITTQLTAQLPSNDFVLEWEHGASMPIEQVIEVALNHLSQISKAVDSRSMKPAPSQLAGPWKMNDPPFFALCPWGC